MAVTCYLLAAYCLLSGSESSRPLSCECGLWCFRTLYISSNSHTESGGNRERKKEKGGWGSFTGADSDIVICSR